MAIIYRPDNENKTWTISEWNEVDPIPEGYTTIGPPKLNWRPIFDWDTQEWTETATEWEKKGFTTEQEMKDAQEAMEKEAYQENQRRDTEQATNLLISRMLDQYILSAELPPEEWDAIRRMYPTYSAGEDYKAGDRIQYQETIYEIVQPHRSQEDWEPNQTPALYKEFLQLETEGGTPVIADWKQPTGAHDAYKKGDKAAFNGKVYESTMDGNIWSPTAHPAGWKEVTPS